MKKHLDMLDKYSPLILMCATAYWAIVGLFGFDILGYVFLQLHLYFLIRLVYIAVGLVGIYELIKKYKPELIKNLLNKK